MGDTTKKQFMNELYTCLRSATDTAREEQRVASARANDLRKCNAQPKEVTYWEDKVKYLHGCENACVAIMWKFKLDG